MGLDVLGVCEEGKRERLGKGESLGGGKGEGNKGLECVGVKENRVMGDRGVG